MLTVTEISHAYPVSIYFMIIYYNNTLFLCRFGAQELIIINV